MTCDCSTCIYTDLSTQSCKRGVKAEVYCMGGGYELWAGEDTTIVSNNEIFEGEQPAEEVDIQKMAREKLGINAKNENEILFERPDSIYTQMFPSVVEAVKNLPDISKEDFEKNLGRELSESEIKEFEVIKESARYFRDKLNSGDVSEEQIVKLFKDAAEVKTQMEARPITEEAGFNGVKKSETVKSFTCENCKHHSIVGCFLGKYYDCVDNNRYLFESLIAKQEMGIEHRMESAEADKAANYIDAILEDRENRKQ